MKKIEINVYEDVRQVRTAVIEVPDDLDETEYQTYFFGLTAEEVDAIEWSIEEDDCEILDAIFVEVQE